MDPLIQEAAQILREGGIVVFPTETVYGIGANAFDPQAVSRVFETKRRPRFNPLIVHIPDTASLKKVASHIPPEAKQLAERFWPGPLTLVLPKHPDLPLVVTGGLPTVGVRMPAHPIAQALLKAADLPIAAPSANRFMRLSSTRMEHAKNQLGAEVDLYLDGGPCPIGVESTIVGWVDGRATLLRLGGISVEAIEACIGPLAPPPPTRRPLAPGSLDRHYAPRTPLLFSDKPVVFEKNRKVGLLALQADEKETAPYSVISYLSPSGDLREAASQLFQKLWEMESQNLDLIVARPLPNNGLGAAINDRLRRAGHGAHSSGTDAY
jgi:L-threonylcarbamoyladenylate synthase